MEFGVFFYLSLLTLGIFCGVINVLAGGGSNLILPLMMAFGIDPQTANATNRVGIWFQGIAGIFSFHKKNKLPTHDLKGIFIPTFIGGALGALLAAKLDLLIALLIPNSALSSDFLIKAILLGAMLIVATLMLFKPSALIHQEHQERLVKHSKKAWFYLFIAGLYGGFVQAGVGFVLITALAGSLHYDLVRANALKLICTLIFTTTALIIFIYEGQILWLVGLILAFGNSLGAWLGVHFAISIQQNTIRWILFTMTVMAVILAFLF